MSPSLNTSPPGTTSRPRRRWLQYSLKSLLIVMLVFGVWLGWKVNKAREQREIVEALAANKNAVSYDFSMDEDGNYIPRSSPPWPNWMESLLGRDFLCDVRGVDLSVEGSPRDQPESDLSTTLARLSTLPDLRSLALATVDPVAHLESVGELRSLRHLTIYATSTNKSSLDRALASLRGLRRLKFLRIWSRDLTDEGLVHLQSLDGLRKLELDYAQVTRAGIERLRAALPDCEISW